MNHEPTENFGRSSIRHVGWKVWENPIFRRYCRSRLRPRALGVTLLITLLIAGFLFFMSRSIEIYQAKMSVQDAERGALIPLLVFQAVILFILGTAQVSGGMTAEKDEGVIDYQRLIPMSPMAKTLGYLFGLPIREYVAFAATLPFTAWALWRGKVEAAVWMPLYGVFFTTALTYHLTGLVTGTVVKNRRWAFLISIGLVFSLYTIVPQMARFGLVFFKYLTITPVLEESLPGILPKTAGAIVATGQRLAPNVKFFNLGLPEAVFTIACQGGLILVFLVMLYRRWRRTESLLLGKIGAVAFFIWIQVLFLGNALPLIESGKLFPSREFGRRIRILSDSQPSSWEAIAMVGIYGLVTLVILYMMTGVITPSSEIQQRGWRRVRKLGGNSLAVLSDPASSFIWTLIMALAGAGAWFVFAREIVESRWFMSEVPYSVLGIFIWVMVAGGICFQALLESKGAKFVGLAIILIGIVPIMIGSILSASSERLIPAAAWLYGISPASGPVYAAGTVLSISELPANLARSVPRAFYFWQVVFGIRALWLAFRLRAARKAMAHSAIVREPSPEIGED